jgi:hypothetical protein
MPRFTAPIRRHDTAKGHNYKDAEGRRVPGVTTIIDGGLPKDALINWAANATADAAINRWDHLAMLPPAARLKALQAARYEDKDRAAKRGTEVHRYAEALVNGETVAVPDELAGHAESYARFLDDFSVEPVHVEFSVASYRYGYAGTADLLAVLAMPRGTKRRLLLDVKTARSGIFGSHALQLAAYRFADVLIEGEGKNQTERPMPEVDGCAAIHVRGDGYDLVPVTADEAQHRTFLYAQQIYEWGQVDRDFVGAPIVPPTTSTYRLVRDQESQP